MGGRGGRGGGGGGGEGEDVGGEGTWVSLWSKSSRNIWSTGLVLFALAWFHYIAVVQLAHLASPTHDGRAGCTSICGDDDYIYIYLAVGVNVCLTAEANKVM